MSVLATADLFIKPDRVDELLEILREALPDTRAYEGCEGLDLFVDQDEPGHILMVEKWTERAAHQKYLGWRQEQGMFDVLADFISAPPRFLYFDPRPDV
jgi:quinol monooxygenase YgiN